MTVPEPQGDEALLTRLRDLALVDIEALLAGASGEHYAELLTTYAEDLCHALEVARARARALVAAAGGPDPMALLDAPYQIRARNGGRKAADRASERLTMRATACR